MTMNGHVAIVTGGARNLGAAIVRALSRQGVSVVIADVLDDLGAALVEELGASAHFIHTDVTKTNDWNNLVRGTVEKFGRIDILVNNAAIIGRVPLVTVESDALDLMLAVNVKGPILGMQAVASSMEVAGGGSIVNISSAQGLTGMEGMTSYTATKFGVRGLTKAAALELGRKGIRVNAVCPGGIDLDKERQGSVSGKIPTPPGVPLNRMGHPTEIADAVVYLASEASSYITGTELVVDGGWTAGFMYEDLSRATR